MIYIINDSAIVIREDEVTASQGGTGSFVSGFIRFCLMEDQKIGTIGNFEADSDRITCKKKIRSGSNAGFLLKLWIYFLTHHHGKRDIFYFQRPDHLAASMFSRAEKVLHLHGQPRTIIRKGRNPLTVLVYGLMEFIAMKIVHRIIVTDQRSFDLYSGLYPRIRQKMTVIPTGINISFFSPAIAKQRFRDIEPGSKILTYIGRLGYPKRVDQILKAFALAASADPSLFLAITGSGNDKAALKSLAESLGIHARILFTGELAAHEVLELLHASTAAILFSENEGSPVSVKECLACGIPVIANDVGDLTDYIIPGRTGLLMDPDMPEAVSEAILTLIREAASMKEECREVARQFDETGINRQILKVVMRNT